jgi:hypothetical protein
LMARENRMCAYCFGGGRVAHTDTPTSQPVIVDCRTCDGTGEVSVFLYATSATLRRMDEQTVMFLAWHGTPKEQVLAEKEVRRREGRKS